jgi:hypothetical protein
MSLGIAKIFTTCPDTNVSVGGGERDSLQLLRQQVKWFTLFNREELRTIHLTLPADNNENNSAPWNHMLSINRPDIKIQDHKATLQLGGLE